MQRVVGANIRRVRKAQGLSQETFGESVGWHRTFVGAVERGERNLTLRTVERISDQLGVHPIDLLWDRAAVAVQLDADGTLRSVEPRADLRAADGGTEAAPAGDAGARRPRPSR
ncbi:helix-turn-helix transcriptional regulator [Aquihabitans sp. G128]|uniref:helix-turn-helix transcriptional regulator n=1 Tax=Aquihabitans sp. G128 TaxID=2849779 RepID=UPI0020B27B6F|nr:helix-turn-helix transcriptional regulator [Aquihabitans sp. G128]